MNPHNIDSKPKAEPDYLAETAKHIAAAQTLFQSGKVEFDDSIDKSRPDRQDNDSYQTEYRGIRKLYAESIVEIPKLNLSKRYPKDVRMEELGIVVFEPSFAQKAWNIEIPNNGVCLGRRLAPVMYFSDELALFAQNNRWDLVLKACERIDRPYEKVVYIQYDHDIPKPTYLSEYPKALERLKKMLEIDPVSVLKSSIFILDHPDPNEKVFRFLNKNRKTERSEKSRKKKETAEILLEVLSSRESIGAGLSRSPINKSEYNAPFHDKDLNKVATGIDQLHPVTMMPAAVENRYGLYTGELVSGAYDLLAHKLLTDDQMLPLSELVKLVHKQCPREKEFFSKLQMAISNYISAESMKNRGFELEADRRKIYQRAANCLFETAANSSISEKTGKYIEALPFSSHVDRLPELLALPYLADANYRYLQHLPQIVDKNPKNTLAISTFAKDVILFFILQKERTVEKDERLWRLAESLCLVERALIFQREKGLYIAETKGETAKNTLTQLNDIYNKILGLFTYYKAFPEVLNRSGGKDEEAKIPSISEINAEIQKAGGTGYKYDTTALREYAYGDK